MNKQKRVALDKCKICGRSEEEHHEFDPYTRPEACVCDPGDWGGYVPDICDNYEKDSFELCKHCEHEEQCHMNLQKLKAKENG